MSIKLNKQKGIFGFALDLFIFWCVQSSFPGKRDSRSEERFEVLQFNHLFDDALSDVFR